MATNEERRAAIRKRILEAATALFMNEGYKKTAIAAIAKRAGVSQVTLYKYFSSKVALGHQIVMQMIIDGYAQYQKIVDDPSIDFHHLVKKMISSSTDFTKHMSTDFYEFCVKDLRGELGYEETWQTYQDGKAAFWGAVIERGRKAGLIRPYISNQALMMYLDMYIQYVQNSHNDTLFHDHPLAMKLMTEELEHLFFYGFIGREPDDDKDGGK